MEYFKPEELLDNPPPTLRAAYSDRTSWLMASFSKLAYLEFETSTQKQAELQSELKVADFELVKTFNKNSTQAFLARRDSDRMAVLVFRGTEKTRLEDIKADLKAVTTRQADHKVHTGFLCAFNDVRDKVVSEVDKLGDYALYITGHSLGGALALIAARELEVNNLAACYTFGSPRVGDAEFGSPIKTPIYRVVNTADIVPRLPPGIVLEVFVDILRFLSVLLPFLALIAYWLDNQVSGYRHHGDMRYLTFCRKHDLSDVELIPNITFYDRWRRLFKSRISLDRHIKDHAIERYCGKLGAYACKRTNKEC